LVGNFSEQKTPNAPNSFLYRAHINLNEMSSAQQDEYSAHATQQASKVSQFCNDMEEEKKESNDPLRISNMESENPSGF